MGFAKAETVAKDSSSQMSMLHLVHVRLGVVCDSYSYTVVTTLAGGVNGTTGVYADGVGSQAGFTGPNAVAVDASGNIIVSDQLNQCIRMVTPAGVVSTIAGRVSGTVGTFAEGSGTSAGFSYPASVVVDASGNILVADEGNHRIRQVTPGGVVTTLVGSGSSFFADGLGSNAAFHTPKGVGLDGSGNIFVADSINQRLRKVSPAAGTVTDIFSF
jgi:serine/threonine-protein kinase